MLFIESPSEARKDFHSSRVQRWEGRAGGWGDGTVLQDRQPGQYFIPDTPHGGWALFHSSAPKPGLNKETQLAQEEWPQCQPGCWAAGRKGGLGQQGLTGRSGRAERGQSLAVQDSEVEGRLTAEVREVVVAGRGEL